jgi:hypothetical protein
MQQDDGVTESTRCSAGLWMWVCTLSNFMRQNGLANRRIRHFHYQKIEIQLAMLQGVVLQVQQGPVLFLTGKFDLEAQPMCPMPVLKTHIFLSFNHEDIYIEFPGLKA